MTIPNVPVEDRMVQFEARPTDEELGVCLGYGLMGSSGTSIKKSDRQLEVVPQQIPIKGFTIWMYFVLLLIAVLILLLGPAVKMPFAFQFIPWAMLLLGGIVVIPAMISMFSWINEQTGKDPYLVFDKEKQEICLPRLNKTIPQSEAREIVFLNRYVKGNQFWQVALLASEENKWSYLHLFNEAGSGTGPKIFGGRELYEKIADELGIDSRTVKFSKRQSKDLG